MNRENSIKNRNFIQTKNNKLPILQILFRLNDRNVLLLRAEPLCTFKLIATGTCSLTKFEQTKYTLKVSTVVGIIPLYGMFNFGGFKAVW